MYNSRITFGIGLIQFLSGAAVAFAGGTTHHLYTAANDLEPEAAIQKLQDSNADAAVARVFIFTDEVTQANLPNVSEDSIRVALSKVYGLGSTDAKIQTITKVTLWNDSTFKAEVKKSNPKITTEVDLQNQIFTIQKTIMEHKILADVIFDDGSSTAPGVESLLNLPESFQMPKNKVAWIKPNATVVSPPQGMVTNATSTSHGPFSFQGDLPKPVTEIKNDSRSSGDRIPTERSSTDSGSIRDSKEGGSVSLGSSSGVGGGSRSEDHLKPDEHKAPQPARETYTSNLGNTAGSVTENSEYPLTPAAPAQLSVGHNFKGNFSGAPEDHSIKYPVLAPIVPLPLPEEYLKEKKQHQSAALQQKLKKRTLKPIKKKVVALKRSNPDSQ